MLTIRNTVPSSLDTWCIVLERTLEMCLRSTDVRNVSKNVRNFPVNVRNVPMNVINVETFLLSSTVCALGGLKSWCFEDSKHRTFDAH